ncbi:MAG: hypothetical protein QXK24_00445 [Ignisphaera sp.]|uniref:Uncharacterized protein n=1 Tax=Ignisphaera aggregans TaxID=334771 RepID=A0A7C4D1H2_9CREN
MTTTSTLLTVVVLGLTLLSVVSFTIIYQQIRYSYLLRMSSIISRTKEAISVGGWKSNTYLVLEVRNEGGVGVFIREIRTVVQILLYIDTGDNVHIISKSKTLISNNIHIPSMGRIYLGYDLSSEASSYSRAEISFVSVMVTTEKNTFIFDVVPPIDSPILTITRKDIEDGITYSIPLPNGRTAYLKPYEILFCAIGPGSRNDAVIPLYDSVEVMVSAGGSIYRGTYHYGYDPINKKWNLVSISFDWINLQNESKIITICSISSNERLPSGTSVVLARGVMLIGTQLSGYDIATILFGIDQFPHFYTPNRVGRGNRATIVNPKTNNMVIKLGLPLSNTDIDVYDFLGTQIIPTVLSIQDRQKIYSIGTYYSQAILLLQVVHGTIDEATNYVEINTYFADPYPLVVVVSVPTRTSFLS